MHKTRLAMVTAAIVSALTLGALTSCAADKTSTQAPAEGEDGAEVEQRALEGARLAAVDEVDELLHGLAGVAHAHRRGDRAAVDLAEALDLDAAGERREGVGEPVVRGGDEGDRGEYADLEHEAELAPVRGEVARVQADHVRHDEAAHVAEERQGVSSGLAPVAVGELDAEEDDVAGLRVGEDAAAEEERVGVHQAAGHGKQRRELYRFRCLKCATDSHAHPPKKLAVATIVRRDGHVGPSCTQP